ncbi:hypothetical protein GCM10010230_14220 [Streptomyces narbonensis]|nr:hypothetical protein GCM10010230_14220 [Streptomyces narbonensis]
MTRGPRPGPTRPRTEAGTAGGRASTRAVHPRASTTLPYGPGGCYLPPESPNKRLVGPSARQSYVRQSVRP